jgi:glycosyltransferase involved in cell wall biosynthesis
MSNKKKQKRILIISAVFPPEPVVSASISHDLAESLSENHEVTVLSPAPSRPAGYNFSKPFNSPKNFKHIVLKSFVCHESKIVGRFRESYSFGKACYKFIKNHQAEIDGIYMNTWPLAAQYLSVKAAAKYNIPVITHIQDVYPESLINKISIFKSFFYKILLPIDKFSIRKSTKVVTISNGMSNLLAKTRGISDEKIEVVYNWQDEKKYSSGFTSGSKGNPFVFMFLGSLSPSAAIGNAVQAFIDAGLKNSKLIIAGRGPEKEKLKSLAINNPELAIEFVEAPSDKVGELQATADVLLLTLKKGVAKLALPSKLPAYMFSSRPIIGSVDKDSDTANAILESDCGWVVEPESVKQFSEAMKIAFETDKYELTSKGEKGFHYAMHHFSKQQNLPKLVNLIEKTAES